MPKLYMDYHDPRDVAPDKKGEMQAEHKAWASAHAAAFDVPESPFSAQWTVDESGVQDGYASPTMGFCVFTAPDAEAAKKIALDCPFTKMGVLHLAQMMDMPSV